MKKHSFVAGGAALAVYLQSRAGMAAKGKQAAPLPGDQQVISGESGAVAMGLIAALMEGDAYRQLREAIGLGPEAKVLFFSSEGATDPEGWRRIVWNGEYPSYR